MTCVKSMNISSAYRNFTEPLALNDYNKLIKTKRFWLAANVVLPPSPPLQPNDTQSKSFSLYFNKMRSSLIRRRRRRWKKNVWIAVSVKCYIIHPNNNQSFWYNKLKLRTLDTKPWNPSLHVMSLLLHWQSRCWLAGLRWAHKFHLMVRLRASLVCSMNWVWHFIA